MTFHFVGRKNKKMLAVEDVLCELKRAMSVRNGGVNQGLPPGFRFHPTDEELVTFYLAAKVFKCNLFGVDIAEIDLNRCEPWELPEVARMGDKDWYFFSLRDRKYPTGLRTNRATCAGYWKATGKDRQVHSASTGNLVGMKKTLVFYHGRAPRGEKTKWVMHEYRLNGRFSCRHSCKDEWVICRIIHKTTEKKALFLDQGQQSRHRGASSLSDDELLPCDTPSFSIESQVLQNHRLLQAQVQEINPLVYPSNEVLLKFNPLMNFEYQPGTSLQSTLFKSQVEYQEHEAVTASIPRQCKTESNTLPHLQDPMVIDEDHFYHYNLCDETLPPSFVLDKIVPEGSWPVDV